VNAFSQQAGRHDIGNPLYEPQIQGVSSNYHVIPAPIPFFNGGNPGNSAAKPLCDSSGYWIPAFAGKTGLARQHARQLNM